jgi:hypothetical protein
VTQLPVDYVSAARRHFDDAGLLLQQGRQANAGQLLGFTMECGLKALLIACGVQTDKDGSLPERNKFRQHMPELTKRINLFGHLIPDGAKAQRYLARLPSREDFKDWKVDHRYFRESALPLASLPAWQSAANEVGELLDQITTDGIMR